MCNIPFNKACSPDTKVYTRRNRTYLRASISIDQRAGSSTTGNTWNWAFGGKHVPMLCDAAKEEQQQHRNYVAREIPTDRESRSRIRIQTASRCQPNSSIFVCRDIDFPRAAVQLDSSRIRITNMGNCVHKWLIMIEKTILNYDI